MTDIKFFVIEMTSAFFLNHISIMVGEPMTLSDVLFEQYKIINFCSFLPCRRIPAVVERSLKKELIQKKPL